jgi:4-amino-4-deoxychorismate lyase
MYLINGQTSDTLSVHDRGLHYGDGLFETLAVQNGMPLCWDRHYLRLVRGCDQLHINCPEPDLLLSEINQLVRNTKQVVLKIIITRGAGGRGYRLPKPEIPATRILGVFPWPSHPEKNYTEGVVLKLCKTRLAKNPALAGIKHLNRLEQVLARSEWDNTETVEGLMLDTDDNVIEGTMSNIFIVNGNNLLTPELTFCGIAGVIRECILDLAPDLGFKTRIKHISETELFSASEIFLCNSVIGLWPVQKIEDHEFQAGPVTRKIHDLLVRQQMIAQ